MSEGEIDLVIGTLNWATIVTVSPDGRPYAIEATPFLKDDCICFMISPRGTTKKNLDFSDRVLLKFTAAAKDLSHWLGVSCQGRGSFVHDPSAIIEGWNLLGQVMQTDYSQAAAKFAAQPEKSPMLAVRIDEKSGRCSAKAGQGLPDILG
jgi:hypothetical protein